MNILQRRWKVKKNKNQLFKFWFRTHLLNVLELDRLDLKFSWKWDPPPSLMYYYYFRILFLNNEINAWQWQIYWPHMESRKFTVAPRNTKRESLNSKPLLAAACAFSTQFYVRQKKNRLEKSIHSEWSHIDEIYVKLINFIECELCR